MSAPEGTSTLVRVLVLLLLGASPLLAGAVHEPVFVPLLVGCGLAGLVALWRAPAGFRQLVPGLWLALGLVALALVQLVPLPPLVLRALSPGSFALYENAALVRPLTAWKPISVSPPDTLRGLAFLAGFALLAIAVAHGFGAGRWRQRLLRLVVLTGLALTLVALLQAVSPEPRRLYGVWQPRWDWAVFGPYVNRNHFAGYVAMAAALALGEALEALARLRGAWGRRRKGFLLLGEEEGQAVVRAAAVVMVVVAGLVASRSRGGVCAFAFAALAMSFVGPGRRRLTALAVALLVGTGVVWIGLGGVIEAFEARGIRGSRLDLWRDMLPMARRFPLFGDGWNAFATAFPWYQTVWRTDWIGEAHNDYLQALLDGGVLGFALVLGLFFLVLRGARRHASRSPVELGLFGAIAGFAFHELVDFNGQIPANAATFVALAALAVSPRDDREPHGLDRRSRRP
jgi:O-antigen ligase